MPWPKTGAIQYHAQLGLPAKGCAIKGLVVWKLGSRALGPAKRSSPRLLSTIPWGINRIKYLIINNAQDAYKAEKYEFTIPQALYYLFNILWGYLDYI